MAGVFISYSRRDRAYVQQLAAFLRHTGLDAWYDTEIVFGDRWLSILAQRIDACAVMVVVMSPDAETSVWVEREIIRAEQRGKEIMPLLLRGEPIIRLSDKHYESVVGGQMPRTEFVERLRSLAEGFRTESETPPVGSPALVRPGLEPVLRAHEDWGDAPYGNDLYGRQDEVARLDQWLVDDRCQLIAVLGIGGVGKTSVVAAAMRRVSAQFDYVLWRSLHNAPALATVLRRAIQFFSGHREVEFPHDEGDLIALLSGYLQVNRCALVLDNLEALLQGGDRAGAFRPGYEGYGQLIRQIGESRHQSCIVITSREKPTQIARMETHTSRTRSLELMGLDSPAARRLLNDRGVAGPDDIEGKVIDLYAGNPLALKIVGEAILESCGGDIALFMRMEEPVFGDIQGLIGAQFDRLTGVEQEIMYGLAAGREPMTLDDLRARMTQAGRGELLPSLASLRRRSIVEARGTTFILPSVVAEYVTGRLVDLISQEVESGAFDLLARVSLVITNAKEFVRNDQVRLIVHGVLTSLSQSMSRIEAESLLRRRLAELRGRTRRGSEYAGGNLVNLLVHLGSDLREFDFSNLVIRNGCLQDAVLTGSSFAGCDLATSIFAEDFDVVLSLAFNPDGRLLATGTATGEVHVWNTETRVPFLTCYGHDGRVRSIAFSPDGTRLVSGSDDHTVRLWDAQSAESVRTFRGHAGRVRAVDISPDGTVLASAGDDGVVRIWDSGSGDVLSILDAHGGQIASLAFSPDGSYLVSGGDDEAVRVWATTTWSTKTTIPNDARILFVAVSRDGALVATGGADGAARVFDVASGRLIRHLTGHSGPVRSVAFSPDGNVLASASEDWSVRLWEIDTGEPLGALLGHSNRVYATTFDPRGTLVASGGEDHTVRLWDYRSQLPVGTLYGHTNWVWTLAYSPDGSMLASGSDDRMVRVWDAQNMRTVARLSGHANRVRSVAFAPDSRMLASGSDDRTIRLWDARSGKVLQTLLGHTDRVRAVAFRKDGAVLASGSDDRTVRLWDVATGRLLHTLIGHTAWLRSVAFGPDHRVASGAEDGTIRLWDSDQGTAIGIWAAHDRQTQAISISADTARLASSGDDGLVRLWDLDIGAVIRVMRGHVGPVRAVALSPDRTLIASGGDDQTVRLWDAGDGLLLNTLTGHSRWIFSVAFHPGGQRLASASEDGAIMVWQVADGALIGSHPLDRQYERMDITGVRGLTDAQRARLKALGAFDDGAVPR